ncbi:hypothetical protein F5890DRAFT_1522819 [Lentinula detonsa]|uniref:Uncharacterized protein n=1 Tax=Lentinula detonsa TaxID=2804962 RepID=A0AA38PX95_9AGAR|nr:hypothetical protein F5890DRAFT_1522819 [Lentinula detonsa]
MTTTAKIVFPPPPPTTNTLTSKQRTQLMRSTKKLGRVLGVIPQLIDIYPSYTPIASVEFSDEDASYHPIRRGSVDSISSGSSTHSRSRWSSRSSSRQLSRTSSPASRSLRSSFSASSNTTDDTLLNSDAKPLLRLAITPPSLDTAMKVDCTSSPTPSSDDEVDLRYTIRPTIFEPSRDSFLAAPTFRVPSNNSLRIAKMDRIRKKLGEDVPIHLVFPDDEETDAESVDSVSTHSAAAPEVTIHWRPLPPLPVEEDTSLRSSVASSASLQSTRTKLSNARDSLLIQSSRRAHKIKRKPVPKFDQEVLEPVGPFPDAESLRSREKERLSLILELPHEHEDEDDILFTLNSYGASPISAWFSGRREDDLSNRNCYHNFLNYDTASH